MDVASLQPFLIDRRIDAWLVYDFRGSNAVLAQLLPGKRWTTRRVMLVIPAHGEPSVIVHNIDAPQFKSCGANVRIYDNWPQWQQFLKEPLHMGFLRTRS